MPTIVSILANAGEVGKTTLGVHVAYEMSRRNFSVALLDLDPQRSLDVFCGLPAAEPINTTAQVLAKNFNGDYPLVNCWESSKIEVCQGHPSLADVANELVVQQARRVYPGRSIKVLPITA